MTFQFVPDSASPLLIQWELPTAQPEEADLALLSALGRDTIDALQRAGYTTQSIPTGQRGSIIVDVVTTLTTVVTNAWTSGSLERALNDASAVVTLCGGIVPVARLLLHTFQKRVSTSTAREPVKITVEIDGVPITVEAADLEQAEAALKLAQRFQSQHPTTAKNVNTHSKVQLKASLPSVPRRKRR